MMKDAGDVVAAGRPLVAEGEPITPPGLLNARPFTAAELAAIPDAVPCLFRVDDGTREGDGEGMMPRGVVGLLTGPPGAGKSFLALEMMLAAANGGALFGDKANGVPYVAKGDAGRVLYLSFEDDRDSVGRRFGRILKARGLNATALERIDVLAWDDLEADDTRALFGMNKETKAVEPTELYERAHATLKASDKPWSLVVVDTLARSARGGVEVDAEAATDVIQRLEQWTKLPGEPVVLMLHHTRKMGIDNQGHRRLESMLDPESVRGSSAILGAVRWAGMLAKLTLRDERDKATRNVVFEVAKANAIAEDAMPRLYLTPGDGGVLRRMTKEQRATFEALLKPRPATPARKPGNADAPRDADKSNDYGDL